MTSGSLAVAASAEGAPAPAAQAPFAAPASLGRDEVFAAGALIAVLSAVLAIALGRDLNWDFFNYHGYASISVLHPRVGQDFFPAGYQGYLNPLPFLPFAWMREAGWHSMAIAAGLAIWQSLNVLFLYLLCRATSIAARRPRATAAVLTLLGSATLVLGAQLGSTFVDPMTTPLVMGGLVLVTVRPSRRAAAWACALGGAAVALKLTNVPFALGLLSAVACTRTQRPGQAAWWQHMAVSLAALVAGFVALYGYWGWLLYREFGSPFFPLFNNLFHAPDFPALGPSFHRFVPQSLIEALARPFDMAEHRSWIYTETVAPDLRPAALTVLVVVAAVTSLVRRHIPAMAAGRRDTVPQAGGDVRAVIAFFVAALPAWMATSANGRYAIPLLLLLGPLIFLAAQAVVGARAAALACLLLTLVQLFHLSQAGNPRWSPHGWTPQWLSAQVPESLRREPMLFVTVGTSSESFVAAYVHPESVFINPIGLISLRNDGPGWSRFIALRQRHVGHTQVLFRVPGMDRRDRVLRIAESINEGLDRLGLEFDVRACAALTFNDGPQVLGYLDGASAPADVRRHLLSCPATPKLVPSAALAAVRADVTNIMDAYETRCPRLFSPQGAQVEGAKQRWTRLYGKFDIFLTVDLETRAVLYGMEHQGIPILIGNIDSWRSDVERFACGLPHEGRRDASTLNVRAQR